MKKLLITLITFTALISCSETSEAERIPWTSSSEEAKVLFEDFLIRGEKRLWDQDLAEKMMDSILKLDPEFIFAKTRDGFGTNVENRENLLYAYENRDKVSDIEKRLIESFYEVWINGNRIKEDQILDKLVEDYPQYYQLRMWSGDIKNSLQDPKASQKRWEEALEINPKAFGAFINLAFLHFPVDNTFVMLAAEERDLNVAIDYLTKGSEIYPESSRWPRFLGNVYRAQGDLDKALSAYEKSIELIEKFEGKKPGPYGNSLLMVGHVNTFKGEYDKARDAYDQGIAVSNNGWKVGMGNLKSHTYMYQKDFSSAIRLLSELQEDIKEMDEEDSWINQRLSSVEFNKFLAFGHSQKEEETLLSVQKMKELAEANLKINLGNALNDAQKERINLGFNKSSLSDVIWYNILFGKYEEARELLIEFEKISKKQLAYNPNAMNGFHKFSGYLNLMEGDPQASIDSYSNLTNVVLTADNYHMYFFALAKKAIGEIEESEKIFIGLANDNFAQWQNAMVKNLAKAQIEVNL